MQGKPNLARTAYEKAIAAGADLTNDFARSRNLGLCYLNGNPPDYKQAAHWFEIAKKLNPSEDVQLYLAQALAWGKDYTPAILAYKQLTHDHPLNSDYAVALANTLNWAGKPDDAFATLNQFLEANPSNTGVRLDYARLLSFSKHYPEATAQYQYLLQLDPNNVAAQVGLAKLASWQDDFASAIAMYEKILKQHPGNYDAEVGRAFTLMWMGKTDEARTAFHIAARKNPKDKEVQQALKDLGPAPNEVATVRPKEPTTVTPETPPTPPPTTAQTTEVPIVVETPKPFDPIPVWMNEAEEASAKENYTLAVHDYHQVLERDAHNQNASIQLARVLSWAKDYDASVAQYDAFLQQWPDYKEAELEKARVLAWSEKYEPSIAAYKKILEELGANVKASGPEIKERDVRLELARVLSWAKHYDESLAQRAILLGNRPPTADDKPALIQKARVLAYARRYDESAATWDQALKLDPNDPEARLGKGQTIYWSGNLQEAAKVLRPLSTTQPKDNDTNLTLAGVEHGLGNNQRALYLLSFVPKDNTDAKTIRSSILEEMAPVFRARFGWEDDPEKPSFPPTTTTRVLRYMTSLEFNVHSNMRMEVSNTVSTGTTSNSLLGQYGSDALATETMVRLSWRPRPWLHLSLGGGDGTTGEGANCILFKGPCTGTSDSRNQHFVYDIHPIIEKGLWTVDFDASRHIADYTPLAIQDNVATERESLDVNYNWRKRTRIGASYWNAHYGMTSPDLNVPVRDFDTFGNGGAAYITPTIVKRERLTLDAGARLEMFTFDNGAQQILAEPAIGSGGFFTPRVYQRVMGTGHLAWDPHSKVHVEVNGTFGPQRIFGFSQLSPPPANWGNTGSVGAQMALNMGRFRPYFGYDYFSTATAASPGLKTGSWTSYSAYFGFALRF